ncbi:Crp/Fnr family transcriptional regulator [Pseudomonas paralcaligenes]|uniref:Crp/Fnr family transcriptional regulator n=1 Tax=Pseudomonas paralcaligenes TaxID=2772558 RepID=UPI001C8144F8|nr:Crp/Fnr family transcriptional regulator [Pseudomonas paralcaligenes]
MTNVKSRADCGECRQLLSSVPLFADLPAELMAALTASATCLRAEAGELLFREGEAAEHFLLVRQGCVEMMRFTSEGEERVFHLFRDGQLIAEAAMFMPHGRYPMNARAQCDSAFYRLGRAALRKACESHPPLAMRMLESLSLRLYRQVNEVDWLTASSASQRLAAYLLGLHRRQGDNLSLPISQRQLATHLGIRPESLSRLLSDWQQAGRVRGRLRQWVVCDLPYLQQLASAATRTF